MSKIPKVVFIVPYRSRPQHKFFFSNYLKTIMDESNLKEEYEVYFSHQCDIRAFNRGATKNIGFLAVKEKYPNDYKNITFVFNDIDTLPFYKLFDYDTSPNIIKHFYGFETALGGIFSIKGGDLELINGFPNYWGWGLEDACIQERCLKKKLKIDRSQFFAIGNENILQFFDGVNRLVNKRDYQRLRSDFAALDGIRSINNLQYRVMHEGESMNPEDNKYIFPMVNVNMVNVTHFTTLIDVNKELHYKYDIRDPIKNTLLSDTSVPAVAALSNKPNWDNIPKNPRSIHLLNANRRVKKRIY